MVLMVQLVQTIQVLLVVQLAWVLILVLDQGRGKSSYHPQVVDR